MIPRWLLIALSWTALGQDPPKWLDDPDQFCAKLEARANGKSSKIVVGRNGPPAFGKYPVRPIASPRELEATVGRDIAEDKRKFAREVKEQAAKGPDFAARYAVGEWSCGSWCSNAIIADVVTGAAHELPFLGVGGWFEITGDHETIERRPDSRLMIVRGSLVMKYGGTFYEGLSGTFSFLWDGGRLRLLTCQIPTIKSRN